MQRQRQHQPPHNAIHSQTEFTIGTKWNETHIEFPLNKHAYWEYEARSNNNSITNAIVTGIKIQPKAEIKAVKRERERKEKRKTKQNKTKKRRSTQRIEHVNMATSEHQPKCFDARNLFVCVRFFKASERERSAKMKSSIQFNVKQNEVIARERQRERRKKGKTIDTI